MDSNPCQRVVPVVVRLALLAAAVSVGWVSILGEAAMLQGTIGGAPSAGASVHPTGPKVDEGVLAVLDRQPRARVIVTLRFSPMPRHFQPPRQELRRAVSKLQDDVLHSLTTTDFHPVYRYVAVPALAGFISRSGLARLAGDTRVTAVTLDSVDRAALDESVPMIRADVVHGLGLTGAGIVVAVLDTGVDASHPDLGDAIVVQECFLSAGGCPLGGGTRASGPGAAQDDHGHGTHVTGIITSNGTVAPAGVAPGAQIAAYKVLNAAGVGYSSDWIAALDDIIAHHPEVDAVNMSLGSSSTFGGACDGYQPAATAAIAMLRMAGVLTFVSSGNHGAKDAMSSPACVSAAVSVGAVYDQTFPTISTSPCVDSPANRDQVACWSNSAPGLDLLAPGAITTSTGLGGGTATMMGTSMAAPHAAGVAALLLQSNPSLAPDVVEGHLKNTGVFRTDPHNGRITARVDALAAVARSLEPDTDGDGLPDWYENLHTCLDPLTLDGTADPDGDGLTNGQEYAVGSDPCAACSPTNTGPGAPDAAGDCDLDPTFPGFVGDGCVDSEEAARGLDPTSPWDFYSVPVPARLTAPSAHRDHAVGPQDAQAVFAYFKRTDARSAGSPLYEADQNGNGVKDGWEYDRSVVETGPPGPPDGAVAPQDAQKAFAQFKAGLSCSSGYDLRFP